MTTIEQVLGALQSRPMASAEIAESLGADPASVSRAVYRLKAKGVVVCVGSSPTKANHFTRKPARLYGLSGKSFTRGRGGKPKKWPAYLDGVHDKKRRYELLLRYSSELESHGFTVLHPVQADE